MTPSEIMRLIEDTHTAYVHRSWDYESARSIDEALTDAGLASDERRIEKALEEVSGNNDGVMRPDEIGALVALDLGLASHAEASEFVGYELLA